MTEDEYNELLKQHVQLLQVVSQLQVGVIIACFAVIVMLAVMCWLAAWSVNSVNKQVSQKHTNLENKYDALEGKFSLLVDVLLEKARRENE